jgi:hypothetical protein
MWRKRESPDEPEGEYNNFLAGCAFALSVVLGTFVLIHHGVHF